MTKSVREFLVSFDVFGEPVGLNYKGERTYKTAVGAFFTICLKILIFVIATTGFLDLVSYRDPVITQVSISTQTFN